MLSFFSSPTQEVLLHQDGLKQMVINNHVLRHEIRRQKEVSGLGQSQPPSALALYGPFRRVLCARLGSVAFCFHWRQWAARLPALPAGLLTLRMSS